MTEEHFVIIGNGPAANEAAVTLRENSHRARITIISKERVRYYRPHLLPDLIAGKVNQEALYVNPASFYKDRGIKLRLGQPVVAVDLCARRIILEHKEMVPFHGLIIATGGRPRIPEPFQVFEELMLTLKTPADARLWIEKLATAESVLIIGGDLTSFALARALVSLGKRVAFILNEDSFWPLPFSEEICQQASRKLGERGVEVIECRRIRRITRVSEDLTEVETDRETLRVGILGAFFGLVPDVKFLVGSGLDIERGILVDEHLRTRHEGVYAAGDCAQVFHPGIRDYWVSIGYENARRLGRIAALNLLGGVYRVGVPPESIFRVDGITVNNSWWMEF